MSSYIDLKFISEISARLGLFKKKSDYLYNFRCPHCGDSQKSKLKARGYMYRKKNDMFFKCHNCGMGQNLANFLKFIDPKVHDRYILERYKNSAPATKEPEFKFDFKPKLENDYINELTSIADLKDDHPAKKYIKGRFIPEKHFDKLYLNLLNLKKAALFHLHLAEDKAIALKSFLFQFYQEAYLFLQVNLVSRYIH